MNGKIEYLHKYIYIVIIIHSGLTSVRKNATKSNCIVCNSILEPTNTKVSKNQKYIKYRNTVCNSCFDQYYPESN